MGEPVRRMGEEVAEKVAPPYEVCVQALYPERYVEVSMERVPSLPEVLTKPLSVKLESLGMEAEVVAVKVPMVAFPIEEVAATVPVNWMRVVVAFARRPPQVVGVQAKVPLPPQAEPV